MARLAQLAAAILKEWRILRHDRAGLLLLFLMPAALVLIITLIQNNILESSNQSRIRILFHNGGNSLFAEDLQRGLRASGFFELIEQPQAQGRELEKRVGRGDFPAGVSVPADADAQLNAAVRRLEGGDGEAPSPLVQLWFDPGVQPQMRHTIEAAVRQVVQGEELRRLLDGMANASGMGMLGGMESGMSPEQLQADAAATIAHAFANPARSNLKPNAVQHNVPAWTMFAIFFIALPLAAAMIRERGDGTLLRLSTMPVRPATLFAGKIAAYSVISLMQLLLLMLLGAFVLPLFGVPALALDVNWIALLTVGLAAGLAATGLGLLLGVLANNHEQVTVAGPTVVVIGAAMGGIMVPVFMMPEFMRPLADLSPLHWGHEAFIDIFVRGGNLASVWPQIALLLALFIGALAAALAIYRRQQP